MIYSAIYQENSYFHLYQLTWLAHVPLPGAKMWKACHKVANDPMDKSQHFGLHSYGINHLFTKQKGINNLICSYSCRFSRTICCYNK